MCSRRKMCSKLRMTVVVPAPDDPVTAPIGCFADMRLSSSCSSLDAEQRSLREPGGAVALLEARGELAVISSAPLGLVARTADQRDALMETLGLNGRDGAPAGRSRAARLLDEERDRIRFVEQARTPGAMRVFRVVRVHIDTAARQDAVHVRYHRCDPTHVEVARTDPRGTFLALGHVPFDRRFPEALVANVDREFVGLWLDREIRMREDEVADLAIECETVRSLADREHELRAGSVERVAGSDLFRARLQIVGGRRRAAALIAQYGEDGADGHVHLDVRGAVERIEHQQVTAAPQLALDRDGLFVLFGEHAGDEAAPFAVVDEELVREHIEAVLLFALHMHRARDTVTAA